ncbi:RNA polymerase sigma factor [Denitromonas sp. IR12]|uniref:RNA polymerase sigma factor n=1 Tax=Denitromonas iodatirespirans TaxID=2795389 RepID=A0A944D889_DENI1|nr:RNA polymerase sigma factor [Denitromonas iodatirespirans]
MDSATQLNVFLAGAERHAFRHAMLALRNEAAALDAVQEAMMRLATKYGDRGADEWPPLFQRILQNVIRDMLRRQKVRHLWVSMWSGFGNKDGDEADDPLDTLEAADGSNFDLSPEKLVGREQVLAAIEAELARLPARQREAFLLRYWEDMSTAETAAAMGCSEGSVKTHCSRATHTLAAALSAKGITL